MNDIFVDYVEVNTEGKVTVCRDYAKGKCTRMMCKYYHVPVLPTSLIMNRMILSGGGSSTAGPTLFDVSTANAAATFAALNSSNGLGPAAVSMNGYYPVVDSSNAALFVAAVQQQQQQHMQNQQPTLTGACAQAQPSA